MDENRFVRYHKFSAHKESKIGKGGIVIFHRPPGFTHQLMAKTKT